MGTGRNTYYAFHGICGVLEVRVDSLKLVTVKLQEKLIEDMDQLVKAGHYHSRSDAIRVAVRDLLRRELYRTDQG